MKPLKLLSLALVALSFSACQEATTNATLVDIQSIAISEKSIALYPTDKSFQASATVTYKDNTTVDATQKVDWLSSNLSLFGVSSGELKPSLLNGGDGNVTIAYKKYGDAVALHMHKLTAFHLEYPDINSSGTGSYIFKAYGDFDNNETNRSIASNIVWTLNGAVVSDVTDGVATIILSAGDANVTATMFNETNSSSPIAPVTALFTIN